MQSFKRLITPANKPQGFGFATFESPEGAANAVKLLDGIELPGMEDGAPNKKLVVRLRVIVLFDGVYVVCDRCAQTRRTKGAWKLSSPTA